MFTSELYLEPIEGLEEDDYWQTVEDLQRQQLQRTKALRTSLKAIGVLRAQYRSELQELLGDERWKRYLASRAEHSQLTQRRFDENAQPVEDDDKSDLSEVDIILEAKEFDELPQDVREAARKLQSRYFELFSETYRGERLSMPTGYHTLDPHVSRCGQKRFSPPFFTQEIKTHVDPPFLPVTKQRKINATTNIITGELKHDSQIHLYDAGNSSRVYIETRIGFAAPVEPPAGWTKMFVQARFKNIASCAACAQWDEWGISSHRQEFSCEGYIRIHEFRPMPFPLIEEAVGLEMRGASDGKTGRLVLKSNGTIDMYPPFRSFWQPDDQIETNWVEFEGPFKTRLLAIFCGVDICHRDDANDYSLFSDLLFKLQLKSIVVEFAP